MVRKTFGRELLVYDGEKDMREGAAGPRWRERHAGNFTRLKPVGDGSNRPRTPIAIFGRAVPARARRGSAEALLPTWPPCQTPS